MYQQKIKYIQRVVKARRKSLPLRNKKILKK